MVLFVAAMSYYVIFEGMQLNIQASILLLPYLIFIMAVLGLGLGIIFSSLTTKYRDLTFLLQFGVQLLMYATPIIYPLSYTGGKLRIILSFNPMTHIVETFRYSLFGVGSFDITGLLYSSLFSLAMLAVGVVIFNQVEKSFMDTV